MISPRDSLILAQCRRQFIFYFLFFIFSFIRFIHLPDFERSGLTNSNYTELSQLYDKYKNQGLFRTSFS